MAIEGNLSSEVLGDSGISIQGVKPPPRALVFDRTGAPFPFPQLLRRSSKTDALNPSVLPKLEANLAHAAAMLPPWFTGPIQGATAKVLPDLDVAASRVIPFYGAMSSKDFLADIKDKRDFLLKSEAGNRHLLEQNRMARRIYRMMKSVDTDRIGYIIEAGLRQPGLVPTPLATRDAVILGSFLMSGISPPGAATWPSHHGERQRFKTGVHAVELGLEALGPDRTLLGASSAETSRRLDIMHGNKGFGNMLASLGMKQPRKDALPGSFQQEQVLSLDPNKEALFTRTFRERLEQNIARVERSVRQVRKSASAGKPLQEAMKKSFVDTLDHIFNDFDRGDEAPGLVRHETALAIPGQGGRNVVSRRQIEEIFDANWAKAGDLPPIERARAFMDRANRSVLDNLPDSLSTPMVKERLRYFRTTMEQALGQELAQVVQKPRDLGKIVKSAMTGEMAVGRMGKEVAESFRRIGFKPTGPAMLLVPILAAGLMATGLGSGGDD